MNINSLCTYIVEKATFNRGVPNIAAEENRAGSDVSELTIFYMEVRCVFIRDTGFYIVCRLSEFTLGEIKKSVGTKENVFKGNSVNTVDGETV